MKEEIRNKALELGVDICGFASIDRFCDAPKGFHPRNLYGDCQTIIVFGIALPKGMYDVAPRFLYGHFNYSSCQYIDELGFKLAKYLEQLDGFGVPIPCNSPYEYWDAENKEGKGMLSMKHAAVHAGLGTLGKNTLLLNSQYGNRLTLGAVLTNLVLPSDEYAQSYCIVGCKKCIENCPSSALTQGHVEQKVCREHTYQKSTRGFDTVECNQCRTVCPMRFGELQS